jgi:protoheme IX farnesyltransferase
MEPDLARTASDLLPFGRERLREYRRVAIEVIVYTWVTVACSLALWPVAHTTLFYPVVAAVLGVVSLTEAYRLLGRVRAGVTGPVLKPMRYFHLSNAYLALLFLAVAIDPLLH